MRGTFATVSPVAGLSTGKVSPDPDAMSRSGWSTVVSHGHAPIAAAISLHVPTVATFCIGVVRAAFCHSSPVVEVPSEATTAR